MRLGLTITLWLLTVAGHSATSPAEIYQLKEQVLTLTQQNSQILRTNELISNNRLARYQAKLLIKTISYEIHMYLKSQGVTRSVSKIESIVEASYLSSWVFVDLGRDHVDRFENIMQWAKDESGFDGSLISHWKAGTYLKSIRKSVLRDTDDYGAFQINEQHLAKLKTVNFLYESGVINFKVNRVKRFKDLMDVKTNCVSRCIIETDRKDRGWEWQHIGDHKFRKFLMGKIDKLERDHLYNRKFVEKYYSLTPMKHYSLK